MTTIYDVARKAGVSPKTVSRVLNGDAPVKSETRDAVLNAMTKLGYVPSHAARTMRSRRSHLIGIITGAITSTPGTAEGAGLPEIHIVQGAQRVFTDGGMTALISDTGGSVARVPELIQTLLAHRVEGLLYVAEYHQQIELPPILDRTKVVLANCFDAAGTTSLVPDDEGGQKALVGGLIDSGHRRIGFLTLPENQIARKLRLKGYRKALSDAGLGYDPDLVVTGALSDPAHEFDLLWDGLERLLSLPEPPSVICCGNDKMAMRVYGLLRERGLRIPQDVSLAGYDDYQSISVHLHPSLTTLKLPYGAIGARAATKLLDMIENKARSEDNEPEKVPGPVIWRDSIQQVSSNVIDIHAPTTTTTTRRSDQ